MNENFMKEKPVFSLLISMSLPMVISMPVSYTHLDVYKRQDIKHTAYMIKKMMGFVREKGDNARHDKWYREAVYLPEDRGVLTLLVNDNHMTDWELYEAFKLM